MMKKTFLAVAVAGSLAFGMATSALAGDTPATNQVAVQYSDLNLHTATGQQSLKRRLTDAAQSVCPDKYSADLNTRVVGKRCVKQAVDQALNVLGERQLARASTVNGDRG